MKKCDVCGEILPDSEKKCPVCGHEFEGEVVEAEIYQNTTETAPDLLKIRDFANRAKTNFTIAIVSLVLCCCGPVGLVGLILSILLYRDMSKVDLTTKVDPEFVRIKNKNLIAIFITVFIVVTWIFGLIQQIVNPVDYNSFFGSVSSSL